MSFLGGLDVSEKFQDKAGRDSQIERSWVMGGECSLISDYRAAFLKGQQPGKIPSDLPLAHFRVPQSKKAQL
jgi:hypothetical protein